MPIGPMDATSSPYAKLRTLPLDGVTLSGGLWSQRQSVNRGVSLKHGYEQLEKAGSFSNLRLAAGEGEGEFRGMRFADSDVYKWLEAVAYELASAPDPEIRRMAEHAIDLVEAAQGEDGYVNSYWQVVEPDRRWDDVASGHELYCAGHLIQAGVAYHRATGDSRLLDVSRRFADYIDSVFGPDKRAGTPGHPEIETALIELYRHTGDRRYLRLAGYFLDQRGRGDLGPGRFGPEYHQDRVGVRDATTMEGHSVRQLYLTAGVADLFLETGEQALHDALMRQWRDLTEHHLFVTGGVGSQHRGEAFGEPFDLPNENCYCETCAQIASIMWNWRMLLMTGEARFADLLELTLYNGFLRGVSLDGRGFFYVNPLQSSGKDQDSGRKQAERQEWWSCACCPPNVMRLIASLGHYFATGDSTGLQVHQYGGCTIESQTDSGQRIILRMETDYPWQGLVKIVVDQAPGTAWSLSLRVPAWCERASLRVNGQEWDAPAVPGAYVTVDRAWQKGDTVELDLAMPPRLVQGNPRIEAIRGRVAIQRGPVVYCLEQADQEESADITEVEIDPSSPIQDTWHGDLLGGVTTLDLAGFAIDNSRWHGKLYMPVEGGDDAARKPTRLTAVPYYAWANRGPNAMRVWVPTSGTQSRAS